MKYSRCVKVIPIIAVVLLGIFVFGLLGCKSDPLDKVYAGVYKWAKHNLPNERHMTIPQLPPYEDAIALLKPEVVYCAVVGEHSWAVAYYGCDRQHYSAGDDCRRLFPGTGYILYSSSYGRKWEVQKQIPNWCPLGRGLEFVTETEGYAIGDTGILYTSDRGKHWALLNLPSEVQKIEGVKSIEDHHLVIACNDNWEKYESFDGGKTWQKKID